MIRNEKLVEPEYIEAASPGIKEIAKGIFSSLGIRLQGSQDRKNLQADIDTIHRLRESGLAIAHYSGIAMEIEAYEQSIEAEVERLVTNTLNTLQKADSVVDWGKVDIDKFNPEFGHRWAHDTSNVSDETLQGLFARLLKGELESPGSVSNDTMSIARDMTKERAEEFQILCSAALCNVNGTRRVVVACGNPGSDSLAPYGLSYDVLMRLVHHRLINNDMNSRLNISGGVKPVYLATHQGQMWLLESSTETSSRPINGILFTPAGEEMARVVEIIQVPEYTKAMFQDLEKQGWVARLAMLRP